MRKPRLGKLNKSILALSLGIATLSPVSAHAVTFGNPVDDPLVNAPYVVSIWVSEKGDVREAQFICSGTLISPSMILTAAHCTDFSNVSFFVKIKAVALQEETQFYAATPWTGTRYDPGTRTKPPEGDIGLLKINAKITDITFPSLATPALAKMITTKTQLKLMGWGLDQNKKLADTLHYSNLLLQDSTSKKYWGKFFNSNTMISAGKYITAEKKWSGSCNGDSGGPLLAKVNGINYVVGVTSWGAQECRVEAPSVFSRVSYYEKDIRSGIKAVEILANKVNRLAPVEVISPIMQGDGVPGSTLTCNAGTWENTDKVEIAWLSPARMIGISSPSTKIIAADAGLEFKCKIVASSKSGDSEATVTRTLTKVLPKKLTVASPPVIGGLEGSDFIKVGALARCEGWNWAEPVDKEVIQWFTTSTSVVTTPVNGKLVGVGIELPITADFLKNEKGRYLVCQLTGTREGFPSYLIATKFISTPTAPVITDVYVKSNGLKAGSNATCIFTGGNSQAITTYEWGYTGAGNTFTPFGGQSADFIQITPQVIKTASSQKLACKVTISYQGEATSKVGNSIDIFESALEAPKVTVSIPSSPSIGSSASCSIPSSIRYTATTYEWGISNSPQSGIFINGVLGRNSSYSFDKDSLLLGAGNYLVCVVTVENEVGKSQGSASGSIAVSAAPALPNLNSFSVTNQTKNNGTVTAVLTVPAIFGFDQGNMEVRLRISGTTCDGTQIFTFPSAVTCSGLTGNRNYSGYLEIKYSTNPSLTSKQSAGTLFTTIDTSQAPTISLSNLNQSVTAGNPILIVAPSNSGGTISTNGYSISPSLPSGLTFNAATGSISGTPTSVQSQTNYTITATGPGGSSTATFNLTVLAPTPAPSISLSNSSQSVSVNRAITTANVSNSGGSISTNGFSVSPSLPAGLSINAATGSISGTPVSVQSLTTYTVTATGPGGSSTATFTLTVLDTKAPVIVANSIALVAKIYASDASQAVTFRATDEVGISDAFIQVFNSSSVLMGTYAASRISGSALDGTYVSSYYYDPIFYPTGTYQVKVRLGNVDNKVLDWQPIGSVQVVAPTDTQNPVVVASSAAFSSPNGKLGGTLDISFQANDNRGVVATTIALMDGSGNSALWVAGTLTSGLAISGTFKGTLSIPASFRAGGYIVCATAIDAANLRSANQCGSRAEYVQIGVIEIVDPNSIYVLTGWEASPLNGSVLPINRGGTWEIKTLDRSKTFITAVVARSSTGSPDIVANSFWKSRSESAGTTNPDNWQAGFSVPSNAIPGSLYTIYWSVKKSDGSTGEYSGGTFTVTS